MALLNWFDAREATQVGVALADDFTQRPGPKGVPEEKKKPNQGASSRSLQEFLRRAEREVRPLDLNFYKKAKLANSFKWRLLEKGVTDVAAAKVTQTLVMHLSMNRLAVAAAVDVPDAKRESGTRSAQTLLSDSTRYMKEGSFDAAVDSYKGLVELEPRNSAAMNNLGVALCKVGKYEEAERYFRNAVGIKANFADAHCNLGAVLRIKGKLAASETSYRRALKLNPGHIETLTGLGLVLFALGDPRAARIYFEKVLVVDPANSAALLAVGQVASTEGRFEEAESLFKRVLEQYPDEPSAWAGLAGLRRMTSSDQGWLRHAEEILAKPIAPPEQANLHFAIGKACDEMGNYSKAFRHYEQGNDLLRTAASSYDKNGHIRFVDDMIRVYASGSEIWRSPPAEPTSCSSEKPVLVIGMPRSGTSLIEQIIASHPDAAGVGELSFWTDAVRKREAVIRRGPLADRDRARLGVAYMRALQTGSGDARRVVDKAPVNSDYLGVIHAVFPNARMIYVRRHPIDTCLSCYFQQFSAAQNFTMDLDDLAHYYRQHHRLMAHWFAVLPSGSILEVPYEELVADQEHWTRKMLKFIGLDWNDKCLNFHETVRTVATASAWQVRQKIYRHSVERWRNYAKFLGPLRELESLN